MYLVHYYRIIWSTITGSKASHCTNNYYQCKSHNPQLQIVIINAIGVAKYFDILSEKLSKISEDIVVVQDTVETGVWKDLGGRTSTGN